MSCGRSLIFALFAGGPSTIVEHSPGLSHRRTGRPLLHAEGDGTRHGNVRYPSLPVLVWNGGEREGYIQYSDR